MLVALVAAATFSGCGSGGSGPTTVVYTAPAASNVHDPGAPAGRTSASSETVATVGRTPITKAAFEHWVSVTSTLSASKLRKQVGYSMLKNQTLGFLITSAWVAGEAANLGISVSAAEVRGRLDQIKAERYPEAVEFKRFLASSGQTEADLLLRFRGELLKSKIAQRATAGKSATTEVNILLNNFQRSFETRWRRVTSCRPGYVVEQCREFKGPHAPPHSQATSGSAATASGSAATGSSAGGSQSESSTTRKVLPSGEVYTPAGGMTISSPAFELNGEIPVQYTCDGAGTSPPLQWRNLPAHTVELIVYVIDDSNSGPEGGIRWVVAGIDPSISQIAGGALPAGAVVGLNSSGKAAYSGICPAKGKSDTIQIVLWALRKKVNLSNGFDPRLAVHEYSNSELSSGVTYAFYTRR